MEFFFLIIISVTDGYMRGANEHPNVISMPSMEVCKQVELEIMKMTKHSDKTVVTLCKAVKS